MLEANVHQFLLELERFHMDGLDQIAGSQFAHIPVDAREYAINNGWVEGKGITRHRAYKITPAGYTALADNATCAETRAALHGGSDAITLMIPVAISEARAGDAGDQPDEPEYDEHFDEFGVPASVVNTDANPGAFNGQSHTDASGKTCMVPGCNQPRYLRYARCQEHQLARWRELSQRKRNRQPGQGAGPLSAESSDGPVDGTLSPLLWMLVSLAIFVIRLRHAGKAN